MMHNALSGLDNAEYIMKMLTERRYSSTNTADLEIVRNVKDQLFQHSLDVLISSSHQQRKVSGKAYELPD